ncbi:class I adenylate-forming enzyme family protein [Desulfopila inferna]|uniref:class I adenylate-forming enzyme family protein n=1 Tax=Desulfopila inferna TaxID=468528 RepID=UPI001964F855|nr:AMP-binding protein [Desulfopila inferna]MBM9605739.1 AMP-binding protein [Desulfopila inferna]
MLVHNLLQNSADRAGGKAALIYDSKRVTYRSLAAYSRQTADLLTEEGLKIGDRVAILTDNPAHYIACYFGIMQAGGIVVGLNTLTSERSLQKVLSDCQPSFLLVSGRSKKYSRYILSHWETIKILDIETPVARVEKGIYNTLAKPSLQPHNIAQIIYTSGTTGHPKGVMLSHRNLTANTSSIIEYLGLTENDRVMAVLPFFYSYGNSVMLTHIAAGGSLVVNQSFVYPNLILDQMAKEKVTGLSGVPSTFAILLHRSAAKEYSFSHLRYLTQAGAPMSPKLAKQLHQLFPQSEIFIMYGQTEASPRLSYLAPQDLTKKPGSIGKAIPGVTLEVLKEDATPAAAGEIGEIVASGDNTMAGYWQRPEETRKVLRHGKLWTGDLAYYDKDGFLYIVSRKSDMIKSGSHLIAPKEIEQIIDELEGIQETAVIGTEDEILGQKIHAYVVLQPGYSLTAKEITSFCRKNLPIFKVPHFVTFLDELPKSESGKIKKNAFSLMVKN